MKKILGLFLPLCLLLMIVLISQRPDKGYYKGAKIDDVTLRDTLPDLKIRTLRQLQGIRIKTEKGTTSYYFEYETNHEELLAAIATLPVAVDSVRSDMQVMKLAETLLLAEATHLSQRERELSSFFWNPQPGAFHSYECRKDNMRHTILLSENSQKVFHRIEVLS